tara:strand:+ start:151 stop:534 length:384 start_codon:yes stop_codon:yes gene_type:complete
VKALYAMMVAAVLLVGCGGGETSYDGTYKMVLKQGEKEMTLTLELKPDSTFVGTNSDKKEKVNGKWKVEGDEVVCTGKADNLSNEDIAIKFNKDSLAATWFGSNDKNHMDKFLKEEGAEPPVLEKIK